VALVRVPFCFINLWLIPDRQSYCTLQYYYDILMQEFGIYPFKLQQAMQLVSMHFRYFVTHTNLPAAHLYHLRRARMCALSHLQNSIESRMKEACNELRLPDTYPGPPPTPLGSNPRSTTDVTSF
jgi:hypothetical protein